MSQLMTKLIVTRNICVCVCAHVHVCVAYAKDKSCVPGSLESAIKILFEAYRKEMVVASFHTI